MYFLSRRVKTSSYVYIEFNQPFDFAQGARLRWLSGIEASSLYFSPLLKIFHTCHKKSATIRAALKDTRKASPPIYIHVYAGIYPVLTG
jgi:hypothetical protein